MASDANPADQASESLKKLTLDNQAKCAEESDRSQQPSSNVRGSESPSKTPDAPVTTHRPAATMAAETSAESGVPYGQSSFVPYYFTGYEHSAPEYEDYTRYVNADVLEVSSPGIFAESGSVLYHPSGYAYAPQVAYGPYSPAAAAPIAAPIPPVSPDPHVYGPPHFQYPGHPFYQQPVSPGVQYLSTPPQISQGEIASPIGTEHTAFSGDPQHLGYFNVTGMNTPRPGYPMPYGSFGQGVLPVSIASPGYDGTMPANSYPDSTNLGDIQQRPSSTPVAPIINQPVPVLGAFGQNLRSPPPIQQPRPLSGIAPPVGAYNRVRMYASNRTYPQSSSPGRLSPGFGTNTRTWVAVDKSRPKGRGTAPCECLGNMDIMTEQNRGPRIRHINQLPSNEAEGKEHESASNGKIESSDVDRTQYNRPDFATKYTDAKFFVIKSYSEDNIHKSIKYGVWASTPNGNKRLDSAYKEAKEKLGGSPVFLFFSVNASGQFCGVAEMLGPVDFERSVDYWQQDKWSGQFPVKWHVIKDVSNSLFRHITLENNDNKPVTNSRDTQEVPLEQGLEMLGIFKSHTSKTSILDDFPYYEARQKLMQEKKARQQDFCGSGGLDEVKPPQQNEKENIVIGETHKAANVLASSSSRTGETQYNDGSGYKFGETSGHAADSSDPKLTTGNSDQEKLSE